MQLAAASGARVLATAGPGNQALLIADPAALDPASRAALWAFVDV